MWNKLCNNFKMCIICRCTWHTCQNIPYVDDIPKYQNITYVDDAFELWCWRRLLRVLDCKEIQPVHPKGNQSWIFIGRTDAEAETPMLWPPDAKSWHLKRPWCWERLKAGGEGDDRGWDGWMASPTQWPWVWMGSGSWWWTGKPGQPQSLGL